MSFPNSEADLHAQLAEAQRRAESLHRVIELISGELDLSVLLTRIVASAAELIGAQYGSIGLVIERPDGPVVRNVAVLNMPDRERDAEHPADVGLIGRVLRARAAVRYDRYGDLDLPTLPEFAEHTVLGIPIWWARRIIGVFGLGAEPPRCFTDLDQETLATFARHAGIAIENARLFEAERRRTTRLDLINRVARLITSGLSFEDLFATAVTTIRATFGFTYLGAGVVATDDPNWLVLLAQAGRPEYLLTPGYRHPISAGLIGAAARTRQRVLVNNVRNDPRYIDALADPTISAELVVPIIVGERLLGVINVESECFIESEEADCIAIIADQFGAALENARLFAGIQHALDNTRRLYELSRRIATAMTVAEVIRAYLEEVAARGRYICTIAIYELDEQERRASVLVRGRWSPTDGVQLFNLRIPYTQDDLDPPLDAGQTILISDVHTDLRVSAKLRELQTRDQRPALALIPLFGRGRRFGLVILSYAAVIDWPAAEIQLYQATTSQLASAIDSRQQQSRLVASSRQVAVLEERRRLARELHDSVTQSLFSMSLLAQVLPDLWKLDRAEAERSLAQMGDLTRGALAEMRELLYELRPAEAGNPDLAQALRARAGAFQRRTGLKVELALGGPLRLPAEPAQALIRIAQEALTNIDHHAQARSVRIHLRSGPPVHVTIRDDGRGFDPQGVAAGRLGLVSMRERAAAIGAILTIDSAPGQGTQILVEWHPLAPPIPLPEGTS